MSETFPVEPVEYPEPQGLDAILDSCGGCGGCGSGPKLDS